MEHTTSITFDQDEMPTGVYSVKLASQDPSSDDYGIKDLTTSAAAVAWGTVVLEEPTGTYSYIFTVENGHVYHVVWEIVANVGETATYRDYQVGPFFSVNNDDIRAVSSFSGNFMQGSHIDLMLKVTNFDGYPNDAEDVQVEIYDPDGTLVTLGSSVPEHVETGYYVIGWNIATDQTEGSYRVIWNYVVDDIQKAEIQNVTVNEVSSSVTSSWYSGRILSFRQALEHHLACSQNIPVYYEQAKVSRDETTFSFSFKNWNQSPGIRIYRNEKIINSGVEVDYFRGEVIFDIALAPQETVNADYNFRWFTDEELMRFLYNALQIVNTFAPHTNYTLETVPSRYTPALLYGAAKDALRQLMMCINFQQPAQVFGGTEQAQQAFSNFETLKKNYENDWEKLLEQKKLGPYPTTHMVVTPEYTLPGGRCLCADTTAFCSISKGFPEINNIDVYTLTEIYKAFNEGMCIQILSHNDFTGNMVFAPVNYIWRSGEKSVYSLKTRHGYNVGASDEHLFFVNGRYIPLMEVVEGDSVMLCDNHRIESDRVKSITKLRRKEVMYDLEISGTNNLFANGIKCHNSRWFRYLFKS